MKKIGTIITILCLGLMVRPLAFGAVTDGLVAYWPVDGNLNDETGNGHNGTPYSVAGTTYVPGKIGQAVNFNASGTGVDTGVWSPNVHNGAFSVACWARWKSGSGGQWQGLIGKADAWSASDPEKEEYWFIEIGDVTGTNALYFQSVVDTGTTGVWQTTQLLTSDVWRYVVGTYANGNAILYVDGQRASSASMSLDANDWDNHIVFGCKERNSGNPFSGALDEIAIWNRELSAAEVLELYNNGEGLGLGGNQWKASNPVPADKTTGLEVDTDLVLQWGPPTVEPPKPVKYYDVYFGTDKDAVADPNILNPLKLGRVTLPSELKWIIPKANLQRDKTYYWRVDTLLELNDEPNMAYGKVWSFETKKSIPVVLTSPTDQLVNEGASASFTVTIESPVAYTVKWYRDDDNALMGSGETLTIPVVDKTNWGDRYYAIPTNANGDGLRSGSAGAYFKTLVAHYTCDEDISVNKVVADSSGLKNKHDATARSTTASATGLFGGAFSFNGSTDWVNCGTWNPSHLTNQMTVSFWSKWGGSTGTWQGFMGKRDNWGAANMMWQITCHAANDGRVQIEDDGYWPWFGQNVLAVDQWSHVAVTFNGSQAELFINGHRVADPQNFGMNSKLDATLVLGASGAGPGDPYKGVLDDVRIYNYVLAPLEIGEIAAAGLGHSVCPVYHPYDYNQDCVVNLPDLVILVSDWMQCNVVPRCL